MITINQMDIEGSKIRVYLDDSERQESYVTEPMEFSEFLELLASAWTPKEVNDDSTDDL